MTGQNKTRHLLECAFFCAITAVASQLILPTTPVPFSCSFIAVFLCGAVLEVKWAFWAQMSYLLLGAVGAPVFSGMMGGPAKLLGPTGGYLFAYPLMAALIAFCVKRWGHGVLRYAAGMTLATLLCYTLGTGWLMLITGSSLGRAIAVAVLPFVLFDLLKVVLSAMLAAALGRALQKSAVRTC